MKNKFRVFKAFIALTLLICTYTLSLAQPPPPPPSVGHGSSGNNPPGAGAPVGEGMLLLIGLAGLYGGKKVYDFRKHLKFNKTIGI